MKRRTFIKSAAAGALATALTSQNRLQAQAGGAQQILVWRKWIIKTPEQRATVDRFLKNAAIPALNRLGSKPIGVFNDRDNKDDLSVYSLAPFASIEDYEGAAQALAGDSEFIENGYEYLNAPKSSPAYQRVEVSLFKAFAGFPKVQTPLTGERIFELRTYESFSELKGLLKVEMFNEAELDIFEKVRLQGVFYGQAMAGSNLPNLTYMLAYKNMDERKAAWDRFLSHPDWEVLKGNERYKDTVSKIVAKYLVPAAYSQV